MQCDVIIVDDMPEFTMNIKKFGNGIVKIFKSFNEPEAFFRLCKKKEFFFL